MADVGLGIPIGIPIGMDMVRVQEIQAYMVTPRVYLYYNFHPSHSVTIMQSYSTRMSTRCTDSLHNKRLTKKRKSWGSLHVWQISGFCGKKTLGLGIPWDLHRFFGGYGTVMEIEVLYHSRAYHCAGRRHEFENRGEHFFWSYPSTFWLYKSV